VAKARQKGSKLEYLG